MFFYMICHYLFWLYALQGTIPWILKLISFLIKTRWFLMKWTIRIKRTCHAYMTQSLHAIMWYLFIIWLPNLMRAMHVYLTSTSSMWKTQWHATQCLSYSSWSHVAHVEALPRPHCVDWSQWRAAGSRRMYSSSLSHTGGTCTKRRCAHMPRTHSFPRTHTWVHGRMQFCTKIHPMW